MKKTLLSVVAIVIVVGGGAFYGGMKYAQSKTPQRFQQFGTAANGISGARVSNRTGNGPVAGEIISKDDKSITVKLRDAGSKIVFYSDSTEMSKFATGTTNDLEIGKSVMVNGKTNQDGSITAETIQIRPQIPPQNSGQ